MSVELVPVVVHPADVRPGDVLQVGQSVRVTVRAVGHDDDARQSVVWSRELYFPLVLDHFQRVTVGRAGSK